MTVNCRLCNEVLPSLTFFSDLNSSAEKQGCIAQLKSTSKNGMHFLYFEVSWVQMYFQGPKTSFYNFIIYTFHFIDGVYLYERFFLHVLIHNMLWFGTSLEFRSYSVPLYCYTIKRYVCILSYYCLAELLSGFEQEIRHSPLFSFIF